MGLAVLKPGYGGNIAVGVVDVGVGQEILSDGVGFQVHIVRADHGRGALARDILVFKSLSQRVVLGSNAYLGQ